MERIGIAAGKISKGSTFLYNFYVILIAFLFSLFIFVVAGATVLFAMIIIFYVGREVLGLDVFPDGRGILALCFMCLAVVTGVFNLLAIIKNIKLPGSPPE